MVTKPPAFQLYAADFLTDTAEMTDQELGVYMRMLCHQWINGSLSSDPKRLSNGVASGIADVWDEIKHKFDTRSDGRLINKRLEKVRSDQVKYREAQSKNGKRGGRGNKL